MKTHDVLGGFITGVIVVLLTLGILMKINETPSVTQPVLETVYTIEHNGKIYKTHRISSWDSNGVTFTDMESNDIRIYGDTVITKTITKTLPKFDNTKLGEEPNAKVK